MNWNYFLTAFISFLALAFPNNIIGCGSSEDPYDYYTSFFSQKLTGDESYRPFYYTGLRFLHDEEEPISTKESTSAEWVSYSNNEAAKKDVQQFVLTYSYKHLSNLYYHIEKKQPLTIPDSVKRNSFTKWFLKTKDLEALGYLMFAKQVEPFVTGDENMWEDINRDAAQMKKLIKNGTQLLKPAKKEFIKLRYGYQIMRLAHYSEQYNDCINYYDLYVKENTIKSILQSLSLSLKAGALKHLGKREEAAYEFSKVFATDVVKRRSNYLSFFFSTRSEDGNLTKNDVLKFCKTNVEKANVVGMFSLSSLQNNFPTLEEIYGYDVTNQLLELLTIREINKLEELYLHPTLQKQNGNKNLYLYQRFNFNDVNNQYDSIANSSKEQAKTLITFCHKLAQNTNVPNRGLFETAAAYTAYMIGDLKQATALLISAEKLNLTTRVKDQWMLTKLLVTINEQQSITSSFEEQLLPSITWLETKAKKDAEWKIFYRNLFIEILAPYYHKQDDPIKEVFCIGVAEKMIRHQAIADEEYYSYGNNHAVNFLRSNMNSKEIEGVYTLLQSTTKTKWEVYLTANNSFSKDDVCDIAGTSYLRTLDFDKAEKWFLQVSATYYKTENYKTYLAANPFANLIYDTHAPTKQDIEKYTKLSFTQKMKKLKAQTGSGSNEEKAKTYFQLANALYQMSYWGNSWMLVEYGWSGNDGLQLTHKEGDWQRDYYGVFKAESFYLIAKDFTKDENFKARCMWMAAKCSQKQHPVPTYNEYNDYDLYDKANMQFAKDIRKNKYFKEFVTAYNKTPFYKEAFNRCVYLKDYTVTR